MGAFVYVGIVQPQLPIAWLMMSGLLPTFVNVNTHFCVDFVSENVPKSCVVFSNFIDGPSVLGLACCAIANVTVARHITMKDKNFFMFSDV